MSAVREAATIVVCVEDHETLDLLCERLVADRYEVLPSSNGADALRLCRFHRPDVLVLDNSLPEGAGLDLLSQVREGDPAEGRLDPSLAIIVLTDRGRPEQMSGGFGADDYVRRPFTYEALLGRIRAALRRRHSRHDAPVMIGELVIDPGRRSVTIGGRPIQLANKEFTLLRVLASDPTRVFGKDELMRDVWGFRLPAGRTRTLDSHSSRLRRKLDPEGKRYVVNHWGIGYSLLHSRSEVKVR
jgi:DNA-binding response OmpR family regulator